MKKIKVIGVAPATGKITHVVYNDDSGQATKAPASAVAEAIEKGTAYYFVQTGNGPEAAVIVNLSTAADGTGTNNLLSLQRYK